MTQALSCAFDLHQTGVTLADARSCESRDAWREIADESRQSAVFEVQADAEADTLCRLLNLFAIQSFLPAEVRAIQDGDCLNVRLCLPTVPRHRAEVIAERMRAMVVVSRVELEFVAA